MERLFKKTPFRQWLDEQPRNALTYDSIFKKVDGIGWKVEDFVLEARKRGAHEVRFFTAVSWCRGVHPRALESIVREKFPEVRF